MEVLKSYVYALLDPVSEECRYVGKANDPAARLRRHSKNSRLARPLTPVEQWIRDLGVPPSLEIISEHHSEEAAFAAEMDEIAERQSAGCALLNVVSRGAPRELSSEARHRISEASKKRLEDPTQRAKLQGGQLSLESRRKMSEASRRKWQDPEFREKWFKTRARRDFTDEHKAKIAQTLRGRPLSPEHRKKIGLGNTGKVFSAERRRNISQAKIGHNPSLETRLKMGRAQRARFERERLARKQQEAA